MSCHFQSDRTCNAPANSAVTGLQDIKNEQPISLYMLARTVFQQLFEPKTVFAGKTPIEEEKSFPVELLHLMCRSHVQTSPPQLNYILANLTQQPWTPPWSVVLLSCTKLHAGVLGG